MKIAPRESRRINGAHGRSWRAVLTLIGSSYQMAASSQRPPITYLVLEIRRSEFETASQDRSRKKFRALAAKTRKTCAIFCFLCSFHFNPRVVVPGRKDST